MRSFYIDRDLINLYKTQIIFELKMHLYEILIANSLKFNMPIWVASLDLRRVFDQIEFSALVEALRSHNLPESYVHLISALYSDQEGVVKSSRHFPIKRGVKQGDILIAILINCILEFAFSR